MHFSKLQFFNALTDRISGTMSHWGDEGYIHGKHTQYGAELTLEIFTDQILGPKSISTSKARPKFFLPRLKTKWASCPIHIKVTSFFYLHVVVAMIVLVHPEAVAVSTFGWGQVGKGPCQVKGTMPGYPQKQKLHVFDPLFLGGAEIHSKKGNKNNRKHKNKIK